MIKYSDEYFEYIMSYGYDIIELNIVGFICVFVVFLEVSHQ